MQSIDRREFVRRFGGLAGLGLVSCSTRVDQPPSTLANSDWNWGFYPATGFYLRFRSGERTLVPADDFLRGRPDFVKIRGGSDRLPAALAAALGERVVTGEHISGARGWMQGAFESGLRAVAEIEARMS